MTTFFLHLLLCLMAHFTRAKPLLFWMSTVGQVFRSGKQVYLKAFLQECIDLECGSSFEELFKFLHSTFGTFLVHCTLDILNPLLLVFVFVFGPSLMHFALYFTDGRSALLARHPSVGC